MASGPAGKRARGAGRGGGGRTAPGPRPQRWADPPSPPSRPTEADTRQRLLRTVKKEVGVGGGGQGPGGGGRRNPPPPEKVSKIVVARGSGGGHLGCGAHPDRYLPPAGLEAGEFGGGGLGYWGGSGCCVQGRIQWESPPPQVWGKPGCVWVGSPLVEEQVGGSH